MVVISNVKPCQARIGHAAEATILTLNKWESAVSARWTVGARATRVSIISKESATSLGLTVGGSAYAVIKASNVIVGVD